MIENLTPFGAAAAFAYDLDGRLLAVLCVGATFRMPRAGVVSEEVPKATDEQAAPPLADVMWSSSAGPALRTPGQAVPRRTGPEIYLQGSAWAPRGKAATEVRTSLQVGDCQKAVNVRGDRRWQSGIVGVRPSAPAPFVRMDLGYDRSFGGTVYSPDGAMLARDERNPIGCGLYPSARDAVERPLPNLEKPGERTSAWSDRVTPWGYGPVPPAWQPRRGWSGTFDERWTRARLPLWPSDTDARFFGAAAPGLSPQLPLRGGEIVVLDGFDPDGIISFRLPTLRLVAKSYFDDRVERRAMTLEAVAFDTDARVTTLFWRTAVPVGRGASTHRNSVIRALESWEGAVA